MTSYAALTGLLPKLGILLLTLLAACALLLSDPRRRALAVLGALVLAPTLLVADIWHSPQLSIVHRHPLVALVAALLGVAVVAAVSWLLARRPALLAPVVVLTLPFRVPIQAGGAAANLLVPLYLVVAAGSLASVVPVLLSQEEPRPRARPPQTVMWLERLLAVVVVLYGVQALYSVDFEKALQQVVFFYVPFTLLFCLLREVRWSSRLIATCLKLVVGLALLFALVGFVEYATKTLLLNPRLVAANDVHAYFTVNSVFFDPDIFGRFLALVMIAVAVLLLRRRAGRELGAVVVMLAVLWGGLILTLSRSSLGALLVGLGALAAWRWRVSRVLAITAAVVALGAAAVLISPTTFGLNQGLNGASSGRAGLISGGVSMFADRPLWGYGSGSFVAEYRRQHPAAGQTLAASHTIPVTIGAEQGLIGEAAYLALLVAAGVALFGGIRGDPARAAVAAAFLGLVFHTLLYADFLEDPVTWTLLGVGGALAAQRRAPQAVPETAGGGAATPVAAPQPVVSEGSW